MNSVSPITAYNQKVNFKNLTKPNFKADKENTIEVKQEKGFSKEAKIVTGVIGALALAGGITYAVMRKPSEGKKAVDKAKEELSKDWNKKKTLKEGLFLKFGPGGIRTHDQRIMSPLRYRCATGPWR